MPDPVTPVPTPPKLPRRQPDGHKGSYGRVLVIAGGREMSGAAVLAGSAALRGGAGLVQVATAADAHPIVAAGNPCYLTAALPLHAEGTYSEFSIDEAVRLGQKADVVAVGPGLGDRPDTGRLVRRILTDLPDTPIVLDADGLNVVAPLAELPPRSAPVVLTPHPGEFARLTGSTVKDVQTDREGAAVAFARRVGAVVLLKGTGTIVTDGRRAYRNTTGNPGMATGGCGDVLTGLIAALIGQSLSAFDAAVLGAWVHGRAGDLAAGALSEVALTAADLLDYLPAVFKELEAAAAA